MGICQLSRGTDSDTIEPSIPAPEPQNQILAEPEQRREHVSIAFLLNPEIPSIAPNCTSTKIHKLNSQPNPVREKLSRSKIFVHKRGTLIKKYGYSHNFQVNVRRPRVVAQATPVVEITSMKEFIPVAEDALVVEITSEVSQVSEKYYIQAVFSQEKG